MLATLLPALCMWAVASFIARRLPHGVTLDDPDAPVFDRVNAAGRALDVGDLEAAAEALRVARDRARPRLVGYVELWLRLVDEEQRRRDGEPLSSEPTRDAMALEMTRIRTERGRPALSVTVLALIVGAFVAAGLPVALGRTPVAATACFDVRPILAAAEAAPRATGLTDSALSHLTLVDPGEPVGNVIDTGLDLPAAARSRHDPGAQPELVAAGFVSGYHREWVLLLEGHHVGAEIFRFASPSGAERFHRQATEYACRFANLAFAGASGETGLQVRYSTGDRIVEQLAWVDGSMRIVVSRGFGEPPPDHRLIIDLARRAADRLGTLQGAWERAGTTPGAVRVFGSSTSSTAGRAALATFFLFHYGMFWFVHGIFVFTLPLFLGGGGTFDGCGMPDPQVTLDACAGPFGELLWSNVAIAGTALFLSHGASFLFNYIGNAEYLTASPTRQMGSVYGRVVVLHLTIIFGAFAVAFLGSPVAALLILVGLKTALDLGLHRREHRAAADRVPADTTVGRVVRGA